MKCRAALAAWLLLLGAVGARADERPPIVISDPNARTYRVATQAFALSGGAGIAPIAGEIQRNIETGLGFSGLFTVLDKRSFLGPTRSAPLDRGTPIVCDNWKQIGADALVQGEVKGRPEGVSVEFRVRDVSRGCLRLLRKRYKGERGDARRIGKAIADDIVAAFTGQAGVSDTEISFVSTRSGNKELYVMDADGASLRAATRNGSINSFPSWSPTGDAIVYTTYRHRNRPSLFLLTRGRRSPGRILRNVDPRSAVYRGVFGPDGDSLAVVMSVEGATEIFRVARGGGQLRRLTHHDAIDVSPTWSPDGKKIAFVSDRAGSPQVYVMDSDGANERRLTFTGSYNTAPAWSPDGRWIAYESRIGGQFDIWLIDPQTGASVPLIENPRSDENPTWAPDSRKLAFSSTRRGRADVYVVDVTGGNLQRLTDQGENTTPAWGPYRR